MTIETEPAAPLSLTADRPAIDDAAGAPRPGAARPKLDLFLISFAILFFELAVIRWFGSTVIFLTFFTNLALMACFLGMSVGALAASRKVNLIRWVIPLTLVAVVSALGLYWGYNHWGRMTIDVGGQTSPQAIYFGTEYRPKDPSQFVIPLEAVAGYFFVLIALMFAGLGQVMGRLFDAIPSRIGAYSVNVLGSLIGIAAFGVCSWFWTSPHVWFAVAIALVLYFARPWTGWQVFGQMVVLALIAASAYGVGDRGDVHWSSYYKVRYVPQTGEIDTNNIAHQQMVNVGETGAAYVLPHLLNRDAGGKPFERALIIGAGSGNDVQGALTNGVGSIDAVEIDRLISEIGKADHPNQPYDQADRVKLWWNDGRAFLKNAEPETYDLAVYALVDSLVLHSGYSSLRLESFLFTDEAFKDVKRALKPGGVFAMYNYYRQGWVIGRLAKMAKEVFGVEPIVISLPYQKEITPADNQANHITFLLVSNGPSERLEAIRAKLAETGNYWVHEHPKRNDGINAYSAQSPAPTTAGQWQQIAPANVATGGIDLTPSDNWPFLYLREKRIPFSPGITGMIVIGVLSVVILLTVAPVRRIRPSGRMFFLGAGFMLLETKGVVHMALLFGSTWVVNSVVFAAILIMILLANLFVMTVKPDKLLGWYIALIAALVVNAVVPMEWFLSFDPVLRTVLSCSVVFVPIFFAAVIFAVSFRSSTQPDVDLGSNIAGIILGGLSEYLSMMLGFNLLLVVAIGYYGLSALFRRSAPLPAPAVAA
jgi:spermidine synthase